MNKIIAVIGIVALLLVGGIFVFGNFQSTGKSVDSDVKEFKIDAYRFGYTPSEIVINQGDKVKIIINNIDTLHGIIIPDLSVRGDETLEFTADKTGEFIWYCANMCGGGHMQMQGKLIVK